MARVTHILSTTILATIILASAWINESERLRIVERASAERQAMTALERMELASLQRIEMRLERR